MKVSYSISDDILKRFDSCAKLVAGGNASLLAEVAMKQLLDVPSRNVEALVRRQRMDRKAATRGGWMRAFWAVLGELMGQPDSIDNPYAPRNFGRFYAVLLLNHVGRPDDEGDPFIPHIGPLPVTPDSPPPYQWTYQRSDSPVAAAEAVAAKLREYGAGVSTENRT